MTKSELIEELAKKMALPGKDDAHKLVNIIFDTMADTLNEGGRIEIRGFGSFWTKRRKARTARNPKSGLQVEVPEKDVACFRAGKELRHRVDNSQSPIL